MRKEKRGGGSKIERKRSEKEKRTDASEITNKNRNDSRLIL